MTMTLIWIGAALWLSLNAAILARSIYVALPARNARAFARVVYLQKQRA